MLNSLKRRGLKAHRGGVRSQMAIIEKEISVEIDVMEGEGPLLAYMDLHRLLQLLHVALKYE